MSTPIDTVEAAIIAKVKAVCGNAVAAESLPARFSVAELKTRIRQTPGVFVTFTGGPALDTTDAEINAEFAVHFAMSNARGEEARRLGDVNKVGAYTLMRMVVPSLHRLFVEDVGSLLLARVDNLFSEDLDKQGVSLYTAVFVVPLAFPTPDPADIAEFLTYHADIVAPPLASPPPTAPMAPNSGQVATDQVTLQGDSA